MAVATYCYYEKMRRTMRTTIVLKLFNIWTFKTFKIKSKWKHFNLQEWRQNPKTFISYKTFTVGKKAKTCQERPNLVSGRLIQVFYKTTTFPRRPLLSGPKSGRLIQVWLYWSYFSQNPLKYLQKWNYALSIQLTFLTFSLQKTSQINVLTTDLNRSQKQ